MRDTKVSTSVIEIGDSQQIVVDAGDADVKIVQGGPDVIRLAARITSGLRTTSFEVGRRGDEIKILSGCQTWLNPGCGVDTTLEIPEGFPVVIRTTAGDVVADTVDEGVLTVQTGSGDISGRGLTVDEFSAETASGDISADFKTQPFALKATTSSGDISARIPTGKVTYAVTMKSTSGDESSDLTSDEDGDGFVRATTASGDIDITTK
nr:DUF4097 family beta strand repeat-containing protein [Aeromicrobium stalagmiti]